MRNWFNRCPAFMKRLWCQLAVSCTLLTFCAMTLLIGMLYGIDDYNDFRASITPNKVEGLVAREKLTVAQAIRDSNNAEWLGKACDSIREILANLEHGNGISIYRITSSSRPEVYIQIADRENQPLLSDPVTLPEKVETQFATQESSTQQTEDGAIWIDMPITNGRDEIIGHLRVLYIAEFSIWIQFQSILSFLRDVWLSVFFCSIPVGIICGLLASRYVTRQLQKMNNVTENWRKGNFDARIELPDDDVLIRHSQHLNDMARDLEMYLNLKQNIAVSDERNRVARELHDTVKQKIFALGLQLATAKTKPAVMEFASEQIIESEIIIREAQHDLMEIITQLRPTGVNTVSLYERIGIIADDFRRRFGVDVELNHSEHAPHNPYAEHHVPRIVQEALANAVRHGNASKIMIMSNLNHGIVTLLLVDNGSGFDIDKKKMGFGLISMRDRMRDLPHGAFEIKSVIGAGTQITLSWRSDHA